MKASLPKPNRRIAGSALKLTLTDTERLNAIFTVLGGGYAFNAFWDLGAVLRDGRRGLDEMIAANPSLLGDEKLESKRLLPTPNETRSCARLRDGG